MSWNKSALCGSRGENGYISVVVLLFATLFSTVGIIMLELQDANLRDSYFIIQKGQASAMAESGRKEAEYVVRHLNASFSGTSQEQVVTLANGHAAGSYQYTVSQTGSVYTIASTGYYPSKAGSAKSGGTSHTTTSTFTYNAIPVNYQADGIVTLNLTAAGAYYQNENGVAIDACGSMWTNSNAPNSIYLTGNTFLEAVVFDNVGGVSLNNGAYLSGPVSPNYVPFTDPLAYFQPPSTSSLAQISSSTFLVGGNTAETLNPGVYVGGISISGNANVTMNPGVYYMKSATGGIGFSITGNASLTANGVVVYLEGVNATDSINLNTNGSINWNPPTTGTYNNFSIFQSRTSKVPGYMFGNSNTYIGGVVYMAGLALDHHRNRLLNIASLIVSDTLSVAGDITMNNYAALAP